MSNPVQSSILPEPVNPSSGFMQVPIILDFRYDLENTIGKLNLEFPLNSVVHSMLLKGYTFRLAPAIQNDQLVAVSLLTNTSERLDNLPGVS